MRKIKKLTALMLAVVMVLAMSITAFATENAGTAGDTATTEKYKITLNGKNEGHTYGAYQIFKGTLFVKDGQKVLSDIEWGNGISDSAGLIAALKAETAFGGAFEKVTTAKEVADVLNGKENDSAFAQKFADVAGPFANQYAGVSHPTADPKVYEITDLEAGYYLIKDENNNADKDAWTRFMLQIVGDAEATVKTDVPEIDKKIVEADNAPEGSELGTGTAQDVGSDVIFQLESKVPDMTSYTKYTYTVKDTMTPGLTYKEDSVEVKIGNDIITSYTVDTVKGEDGKTNITIDFTNFLQHKDKVGQTITIQYKATINEGALTRDEEKNTVKLEYSNNPYDEESKGTTPEKEVYVYDFDIVIDKYEKGDTEHKLEGAEFVLKKGEKYYFWNENEKKVDWVDSEDKATKRVTDEDGAINFAGLDSGNYSLIEVKAPDGYNKLSDPISVEIKAAYDDNGKIIQGDGTNVSVQGNGQYGLTSSIENSSGSLLPSTGGIGTTIFYIVGAILVIGAGVILVVKKRMSNE